MTGELLLSAASMETFEGTPVVIQFVAGLTRHHSAGEAIGKFQGDGFQISFICYKVNPFLQHFGLLKCIFIAMG